MYETRSTLSNERRVVLEHESDLRVRCYQNRPSVLSCTEDCEPVHRDQGRQLGGGSGVRNMTQCLVRELLITAWKTIM